MTHWKSCESPRSVAETPMRYVRAGLVTGSCMAALSRSLRNLLGGMLDGFLSEVTLNNIILLLTKVSTDAEIAMALRRRLTVTSSLSPWQPQPWTHQRKVISTLLHTFSPVCTHPRDLTLSTSQTWVRTITRSSALAERPRDTSYTVSLNISLSRARALIAVILCYWYLADVHCVPKNMWPRFWW